MFEGKPPVPPAANGEETGDSSGEALCPLTWPDLVAKLAAARDLRESLVETDEPGLASFDAHSAQQLALHHERGPAESERDVNPDDLANRKDRQGKAGERADGDPVADRGNT